MEVSFQGTWNDGYVPEMERLKHLARKYRELDLTPEGVPMQYGFSCDNKWSRVDYFASMASALRNMFHRKNVPADIQNKMCFSWVLKIDKKPTDERVMPIYEEYVADPRRDGYCHIINIHEAHLYRKCDRCIAHTFKQLDFEPKLRESYRNFEGFQEAVEQLLTEYVDIMGVPQTLVDSHLKSISNDIYFSFF